MTITRSGGEGFDLPRDVNKEMADNPYFSYTNNSDEYTDFEDGQGYLELTRPEKDMIELATKTSTKTVVVINAANAFQLGDLQDDPEIDAIVWAIPGGQVGFNALGRILDGEVNPSAKTPDTFARDIKAGPAANNFGDFQYTNMTEFAQDDPFNKGTQTQPSFVNYSDSIYVGYRWYETAAADADASATMPTTGAKNGLVLGDLAGLDYNDPKWDQLLDQLSIKEMNTLISKGGYGSPAISSIGKLRVSDVDGPASLNNNFTGVGSIGLPYAVSVAATFNKELARSFGDAIGTMAHDILYTVANSWMYENGQPEVTRNAWEYITWVVAGILILSLLGLEVVAIRRYRTRKAEAVITVEANASIDEAETEKADE